MQRELTGSNGMRFVRFTKAETGDYRDGNAVLVRPDAVVSLVPVARGTAGAPREHTLIGFESGFCFEVNESSDEVQRALSPNVDAAPASQSPARFVCYVFINDESGALHGLLASGPHIVPRDFSQIVLRNEELIRFTVTLPCSCVVSSYLIERNGDIWQSRSFEDEEQRPAGEEFVVVACRGKDEA